jgi:hypothetical protein
VMWLDAIQVGDKPVFCGVAALDSRGPDWTAHLDTRIEELQDLQKAIDTKNHYLVSMSGYSTAQGVVLASLWRKGKKLWFISPANTPDHIKAQIQKTAGLGASPRVLRNYPIGAGGSSYALYGEVITGKTNYALDQDKGQLDGFLADGLKSGFRPLSVSGSIRDRGPVFAAVMEPNPEKWECQTDTNLTAAGLKAKAATVAKSGYRPWCVTAYPWDGAVRYCAVWVKEPPEAKEPPKKP